MDDRKDPSLCPISSLPTSPPLLRPIPVPAGENDGDSGLSARNTGQSTAGKPRASAPSPGESAAHHHHRPSGGEPSGGEPAAAAEPLANRALANQVALAPGPGVTNSGGDYPPAAEKKCMAAWAPPRACAASNGATLPPLRRGGPAHLPQAALARAARLQGVHRPLPGFVRLTKVLMPDSWLV
jgi:hypothetical protein